MDGLFLDLNIFYIKSVSLFFFSIFSYFYAFYSSVISYVDFICGKFVLSKTLYNFKLEPSDNFFILEYTS
jgi:hypothetical protein